MKKALLFFILILVGCYLLDDDVKAILYPTTGNNTQASIGTVTFTDTPQGLMVDVSLNHLPKGKHGFHIHEFGNCKAGTDQNGAVVPAFMAGGHYDPEQTGKHLGPKAGGHKGDLPALEISEQGSIKTKFYVPSLTIRDIRDRSVVVHEGGDNYSDIPSPLGGGGKRIACGVIE